MPRLNIAFADFLQKNPQYESMGGEYCEPHESAIAKGLSRWAVREGVSFPLYVPGWYAGNPKLEMAGQVKASGLSMANNETTQPKIFLEKPEFPVACYENLHVGLGSPTG